MTDQQEFYDELLGVPWEPDPIFTAMYFAVEEYHESCEEYDKAVCTRRHRDIAMPDTDEQRRLINVNARLKRENLLHRVSRELEIPRETAESYWREAMKLWRVRQ